MTKGGGGGVKIMDFIMTSFMKASSSKLSLKDHAKIT